MLSTAEAYLRELNPAGRLEVFGQELNPETYAVCKADMMIKGQDPANIVRGNSFSEDGHSGRRFDRARWSCRSGSVSGVAGHGRHDRRGASHP